MTYQQDASRTEPTATDYDVIRERMDDLCNARLIHAAFGMQTEAGEFTDQLKKALLYGKPLDRVNLAEELGDVLWYVAIGCNALGIDMQAVMDRNIEKLRARFPEKFTDADALERDLAKERKVLEGT